MGNILLKFFPISSKKLCSGSVISLQYWNELINQGRSLFWEIMTMLQPSIMLVKRLSQDVYIKFMTASGH